MPHDKNFYWTGLIFFIASMLLRAAWWEALIIACLMSLCWYLSYGQRVIRNLGPIFLLWSLLTWSGVLPAPDLWLQSLSIVAR